jgi:hypothetical protein
LLRVVALFDCPRSVAARPAFVNRRIRHTPETPDTAKLGIQHDSAHLSRFSCPA